MNAKTDRAAASADDETWMGVALAAARQAHARGDWPTGAVLVRDGRLLATGQNRQNSQRDVTAHAELDVLKAAFDAHGLEATRNSTMYCTMEPCPMCAGALKLAGIRTLVLALRHATLRRTDLGDYSIERFCAMTGHALTLRDGVLEDEYLLLRREWGQDPVAPQA